MADESVDTGGAYVGFRATNIKYDEELEIGDEGTLIVKFECVGAGKKLMADGELRDSRSLKVLWVGAPGSKPPAPPQAGMFDKGGNVTPQATGADEDDDSEDGEP